MEKSVQRNHTQTDRKRCSKRIVIPIVIVGLTIVATVIFVTVVVIIRRGEANLV